MGGVVARLAAVILAQDKIVNVVVTLNSPHQYPPLFLDKPMHKVFSALANIERNGHLSCGQ